MSDTFDVVMAAYQSIGPAERDFDALVRLIGDKKVRSEGVILVEHDASGKVRVTQTGDHLGRRCLGWGGGVEQALAGSPAKSVAPMTGKGLRELKAALAEAAGKMPHTVPIAFSSYAGMDIGRDNGLVVDLAYQNKAPYVFTGTVKKVVFDLKPATHEDEQALHEHAQVHGIGEGASG